MRAVLGLGLILAACSPTGDAAHDQELDAFEQQFAGGKGDGYAAVADPCKALGPLRRFGHDMVRAAFFMGYAGEGALGVVGGSQGMDYVFDIYHRQLGITNYLQVDARTPGLSVGLEGYVGVAFGMEHGAVDWEGYFASYEGELSLPFLKDYLSAQVTLFQGASDDDHNGIVTPGELIAPPRGVYGFSVGLDVSVGLPTGIPFEGSASSGKWTPNKQAVRKAYDDLRDTTTVWPDYIDVRLVDAQSGAACDRHWPRTQSWRDCVIAFGDKGEGPLGSSIDMAFGLCHLAGHCLLPLALPMSLATVALGALGDDGVGACE